MIPNNLNLVRSNQIVKQFHSESDRAAAILAGSHVEQSLKEFIQLFIIEKPEIATDKLLEPRNSVSSFGAQIEFARACDWITEDIKKDLNTIRIIRNEFAHNPDLNNFSQIPNIRKFQDFSQIYYSDNLRLQYLTTATMTVGQMWNKILPFLKQKQKAEEPSE